MFDPRIETIKEIVWNGEQEVDIKFEFCCCSGMKRKDFWNPEKEWETIIKKGTRLKLWSIQWSRVIGVQIEIDGNWVSLWCQGNDFQTKADRDAANDAYTDFVEDEAKKIAKAIDEGLTYAEIDKKVIDKGHTGHTFGCAIAWGIDLAENKERAEVVRKCHNAKYTDKEVEGTVNPAIMTIG